MAKSRTPDIMADSAHVILTADAKLTTDNFFIDDEVLISSGQTIDDLAKYSPVKGFALSKLMPDFIC
jgi:citronellol/citronellal dehydrogenase